MTGESRTGCSRVPAHETVREQLAVKDNHCLKTYLLLTFRKRIDLLTADIFLSTSKTQKPRQSLTCSSPSLNITLLSDGQQEQQEQGHLDVHNAVALRYIKEGDVVRLFQWNTTTQYDSTYTNTPRSAQGKQPLCANLLRTTLNAVDYKTCTGTNKPVSLCSRQRHIGLQIR